jgi:hypothetical protein
VFLTRQCANAEAGDSRPIGISLLLAKPYRRNAARRKEALGPDHKSQEWMSSKLKMRPTPADTGADLPGLAWLDPGVAGTAFDPAT